MPESEGERSLGSVCVGGREAFVNGRDFSHVPNPYPTDTSANSIHHPTDAVELSAHLLDPQSSISRPIYLSIYLYRDCLDFSHPMSIYCDYDGDTGLGFIIQGLGLLSSDVTMSMYYDYDDDKAQEDEVLE